MSEINLEEIKAAESLPAVFSKLAARIPERAVYSQPHIGPGDEREWRGETYHTVARKVWKLSNYLRSNGVKPGDKVAIISFTRPEWMIADLAILYAGAVSVSIYQSVNVNETGYILYDSGARWVFAENEEQVKKLEQLLGGPFPIAATEERPAQDVRIELQGILSFEQVENSRVVQLESILSDPAVPDSEPDLPKDCDLASLVYTSGTTGAPKGVVQTHRNHLANLWQACQTGLFAPDGDIFLFLPLAHSFARLIGYIGFLTPTLIKFPAVADRKSSALNAVSVLRDVREGGAQVVPMVPRILEKMANGVQEKMRGKGLGAKILAATVVSAQRVYEARSQNKSASLGLLLAYSLLAPIRKKIKRQLFGEGFRHVVSGGAKLPVTVNTFFTSLGITIYEGYGLTETCVATNVNRIGNNKIGSVGPCLAGIEMKIAEDGEILFRGPNVTSGYFNRPAATAAAWDADGWFHTGDLGHVDAEGSLYITGRKKELIVTSGGKKISPLMIEDKLAASPFISSAVVVGDGRQYCAALLVPDMAILRQWAERKGIKLQQSASATPEIVARLEREIEHVNKSLSRFETIKRFRIIDQELTVDNGFLTPTFKVKRALIEKTFKHLIDEMYADEAVAS